MKREDFIEQLVEDVKSVPISEVFRLYDIELFPVGSSYSCYSPFREDSSKTSFTISDDKGIFKDWLLEGEYKGDSIKFVSLLLGISYFQAIFELALKLEVITEVEYKQYYKGKRYDTNYQANLERKHNKEKQTKKPKTRANIKDLDKVYSMFIDRCKLSEEHKKYLLDHRGLSEETIKDMKFFTFPTRHILRKFLKEIKETYGSTDILKDIPGFYRMVGEDRFTFNKYKGMGIPIMDYEGRIEGIQIRVDTPFKDSGLRYFWFSSSFAIEGLKDDVTDGTGATSSLGVIYPKETKYDVLFITEGVFKALKIADTFNSIAISVQGVGNWYGIDTVIKNIERKRNKRFIAIYIAYDSDIRYNFGVYNHAYKLSENLMKTCSNIHPEAFFYSLWDEEFGKGIDDMINNKKKDQIKKVKVIDYNRAMKTFEEYLKDKYQVDTVVKLSQDIVREEYYKKVRL